MCGLAGMASLGGALAADAPRTASAMAGALVHRGPDGAGLWSDERVALSHRRLAIIDVSEAGAQPMISDSGRLVVVFNGEIYNFRELSARLRSEGWRSRGSSDTEVLLAAVESWGVDRFLQLADGMFAFALYDRSRAQLILARDRFGEKPLAWCIRHGHLYFASELRSFAEVPGLDLALDAAATADYFRFGHVPGTSTIYAGVRRLAAGTVMVVDLADGTTTERAYWQPGTEPAFVDSPDSAGQLREVLADSVRTRLIADRPVGAFLSGGIDSSLICALAAEHVSGALKTFTMGWDDAEYDESVQAARVASALGADHHDVRLGRAEVARSVERLGGVMDEPFGDSSQLAVLLVASAARDEVVVALSGDGGDELFAGYNRHRWLLSTRGIRHAMPESARQQASRLAHRTATFVEQALRPIPPTRRPRFVADKVRKMADVIAAPSLAQAYDSLLALDGSIGRPQPLGMDVLAALASDDRDEILWALRVADLSGYLCDDILTKVDRATMSVSLESRAPFLQPDLVHLALGMRAEGLLGAKGGKQPLRSLLASLLPTVPFDQTKTGFGVPVASLLRTELRPALFDAIATHRLRGSPVSIPWSALWSRLAGGDDAPAAQLWSLLMFELWAAEAGHPIRWEEGSSPVIEASSPPRPRPPDRVKPVRVGLFLPGVSGPPSGAWTRLRDLANGLQEDGEVELFVAAGDPSGPADLGIPAERTRIVPASRGIRRFVRTSAHVQRFIDQFDLDLVQVEAPPVPRGVTTPVVFSLHDLRAFESSLLELRSPGALYQRLIFQRHLLGVDAVLSLSSWAARDFGLHLRLGPERIHVVGPITPASPRDAAEPPTELVGLVAKPFVVSVGHLEARKNIELLIEATQEPSWPAELALVLAGKDNGSEASLKEAAASASADIRFLGPVTDAAKWWLLRNAEVVLLPSRLEGFGIVALEAMSASTPVLVANSSALPEAVGTPDAVLPLDDASAWSKRIRELHLDEAARASLTERQAENLTKHSADAIVSDLKHVYGSVIGAASRHPGAC